MAADENLLGQSLLTDYGKCLSVYHGKGVLTLEDGKKYDCQFEAGQLNNGRVLLLCDFLPPFPTCSIISAAKFEGTTSEGFRICANKVNYPFDITVDSSPRMWAALRLDEMSVVRKDRCANLIHYLRHLGFCVLQQNQVLENGVELPLVIRNPLLCVHACLHGLDACAYPWD